MIQIIDGKRYNTETATKVGEYWNGYGRGDFHQLSEDLYQTPKGGWFIKYVGGALTQYAEQYGNMSGGGSGLRALTAEEAFEWLQTHEKTEALEKYFSERLSDA